MYSIFLIPNVILPLSSHESVCKWKHVFNFDKTPSVKHLFYKAYKKAHLAGTFIAKFPGFTLFFYKI